MDYLVILGILACFIVYMLAVGYLKRRKNTATSKILDMEQYLPEDEIHSLHQVFYLGLAAFFVFELVGFFYFNDSFSFQLGILNILTTLVAITFIYNNSYKTALLSIFLFPLSSAYALITNDFFMLWNYVHIIAIVIMIVILVQKFIKFTENNNLSLTMLFLIALIAISFFSTIIVEQKSFLDSFVMVSNAFTSNGYAVLGNSIHGKLNSIVLVWGGYILSGVGTATLTGAILTKYFNKRLKVTNDSINELNQTVKELKEEISKNNE